jgi:hypothetical protein
MRNLSVLAMLPILLTACSQKENPEATLRSPNGDYFIKLYKKDLGACCTARVYANIISQGEGFGELDERIFEIEGGSNVQVNWTKPYHVEIHVCNAKSISYTSDFANYNFTKHIHITVENRLPQRTHGEVICTERSALTTHS